MTGHALWWDTPWHPRPSTPPVRTDVVIIGGGLTGVVAGIDLLTHGLDVTILEAAAAGAGASGKAFGSIAIGCTASPAALSKRYGPQRAEAVWRESSDTAHVFADYIAETGIDCEYRRTGHIRVAIHPGQEPGLRADYEQWRRLAPKEEITLLSADDLDAELPGAGFRLGLLDETSAAINPHQLLGALVRRFQDLGGNYCEHTLAHRIARQGNIFAVRHSTGTTQADRVLVATNGHTGPLLPWLRRRVYPVGSYMIATDPLAPELQGLFSRRTVTTAFARKNYFRLTGSGRLIFGGRLNLTTTVPEQKIKSQLHRSLLNYFPALKDTNVSHSWGGSLGFTVDQIPHLGVHDGVHYALGYCGRGLPTAVHLGRLIARQVVGRDLGSAFRDLPLVDRRHHGRPSWVLPLIAGRQGWQDRRQSQ